MGMSKGPWNRAPTSLVLDDETVHVWRASLDADAARLHRLARHLSDDERERASQFRAERNRLRYLVAHGLLREILSRYLGAAPSALRFRRQARGKPELDGEPLRFNMSHAGDRALYAVTRRCDVGIDLERVRAELAVMEIARRFFSPREVTALEALPDALRREAFFACWTRKEAFIKATGQGLVTNLSAFAVSLAPGEPAQLLHVEGDPGEPSRWTVRAIEPGEGYAGAVVVRGPDMQVACYETHQE